MAANTDVVVYEDYRPYIKPKLGRGTDTLVVDLPGFRKQNLTVQVTSVRSLRITGQKELLEDKRTPFQKDFDIPTDCDVNKISAEFEHDKLYVKLPKIGETENPAGWVPRSMGGLFRKVKQSEKLLNLVLVVLVILVLGLYRKNIIQTSFTITCKCNN